MTDQKPTIGRIVHYVLSEGDAAYIDQVSPQVAEGRQVRNAVYPGDAYPAVVVRVFDSGAASANLRVMLDGLTDYWATSRCLGAEDQQGYWHWPERV